jgi:hypothetical protein
MRNEGTTPKEIKSAKESNSLPKSDIEFNFLAKKPSK